MSKPVSFRWTEEFVARLDRACKTPLGRVSRSAFVRDAVELQIRQAEAARELAEDPTGEHARRAVERAWGGTGAHPSSRQPPAPAEQPEMTIDEAITAYGVTPADESTLTRVSTPKPIPPRVPFRRDVKPFQRGA